MENKTTKPSDGSSGAVVQDHKADSLTLPVGEMERLHKLNPDYAKAFIDQAERESRRAFINEFAKQVCAPVLIGLSGVAVGGFLVYTRPEVAIAGAIITAVSVSGLAVAFVRGRG